MKTYLPEGMGSRRNRYTMEQLRKAMEAGTILEATALVCTQEHDLLVDLGCCRGRIPRNETALGIADGTTRDIAILARVGKPVCFRVMEVSGREALLSRRLAQEEARTAIFSTHRPGDILPAVVTNLASFGAFCDVGCGVPALLGIEHISVSRIDHSRDRFREDQPIFAVIRAMEPDAMRIHLSHRELLGTWEENADQFQEGQTVTGIVRSIQDYGAFVELAPNLSGLAEPNLDLRVGDAISVYIKSIIPNRLKIKLVALRRLDAKALPRQELVYYKTSGHIDRWQYGNDQYVKTMTVFG